MTDVRYFHPFLLRFRVIFLGRSLPPQSGRVASSLIEKTWTILSTILFSDSLQKFYVVQTHDLTKRIEDHNSGKANFTSKGVPWKLVHFFECIDRSEATRMETSIKKRGIKRYLQNRNIL